MIPYIGTAWTAKVAPAFRPLRALVNMVGIARERHSLAQLDDHLLRDIGLSRAEADAEATRQWWDAPAHWYENRGGRD